METVCFSYVYIEVKYLQKIIYFFIYDYFFSRWIFSMELASLS